MRLSPPITVLAVLALPLVWLSVTWRQTDCYFAPDGRARFSNAIEAAVNRVKSGSGCDVWAGIASRKSIETIELTERTDGGAMLVARISPDGNGFVAVLPPYDRINHPVWRTENPPIDLFEKYSRAFATISRNPATYNGVRAKVGVFRDFQGGFFLDMTEPKYQKWVELNHPSTRRILCRKPYDVMPVSHGPIITFRFASREAPVYVSTGTNCRDSAQLSAERRVSAAISDLVDATGRRAEILAAAKFEYPYCGMAKQGEPCIMPRL